MAIHRELSTDIAVALLTGKERDPEQLKHLKDLVFKVHHTLQRLKDESRKRDPKMLRGRDTDRRA